MIGKYHFQIKDMCVIQQFSLCFACFKQKYEAGHTSAVQATIRTD